MAGSSIGRTPAFGAGCWRFEPSPASDVIERLFGMRRGSQVGDGLQ